jgi:hypothetical protein
MATNPLVVPTTISSTRRARFVAYKLRMNRYSKQSADSKLIVLLQFAGSLPARSHRGV